jgi:hypothetical protein
LPHLGHPRSAGRLVRIHLMTVLREIPVLLLILE